MTSLSERTVVRRINRRLDGQRVKMCRPDSRGYFDLGRFYAVDERNNLSAKDIDIEAWARDLGAMSSGESIATE